MIFGFLLYEWGLTKPSPLDLIKSSLLRDPYPTDPEVPPFKLY